MVFWKQKKARRSTMITVNGIWEKDKSTWNKEEKMNARKVLCVVCVLVVGLAIALEITALAGPPSVEYRPGVNVIYRGVGYNVAPKVSVPVYQVSGSKLPSFYRGWTSASSATQNAGPLYQYSPGNYLVPEVRVPRYDPKDCKPPHDYILDGGLLKKVFMVGEGQ
jgi:hypothetical protein